MAARKLLLLCSSSLSLVATPGVTISVTPRFTIPFASFRIFQLIANSHTVTGFYQFVQVSIQCMMWKTSQFMTGSTTLFRFVSVMPKTPGS